MPDSNEIFELCQRPPSQQLEEHWESNPVDQLRFSPNGQHVLYLNEGESIRSPHPIRCENSTPSLTSDQLLDYFSFDGDATYPQSTVAPIPPANANEGRISELRPRPHLEESGSDPPEQLRRMEEELPLVSDIQEPHMPTRQSSPSATVIPSPSQYPLRDYMEIDYDAIHPQSTVADNPPTDHTSGAGPSQQTSLSPPANANDSNEEHASLKVIRELFDSIFCAPFEATMLRYKTLLDYLNMASYGKNDKNFVLVKDFFLRFADVHEQYNSLTYRPDVIAELQEKMFEEFQFLVEKYHVGNTCTVTKAAEKCLIPNQLAVPVGKEQQQPRDTSASTRRKRKELYIPEQTLVAHRDKNLDQAAKAIGISESKLKKVVQGYGYDGWSDFKFKRKNDL